MQIHLVGVGELPEVVEIQDRTYRIAQGWVGAIDPWFSFNTPSGAGVVVKYFPDMSTWPHTDGHISKIEVDGLKVTKDKRKGPLNLINDYIWDTNEIADGRLRPLIETAIEDLEGEAHRRGLAGQTPPKPRSVDEALKRL
jgi:hypothetical protein